MKQHWMTWVLGLTIGAATLFGCGQPATNAENNTSSTTGGTEGGGGGETAGGKRPAVSGTPRAIEGDTIKIGIVASLNGALKPWGDDSYNGAKMAVSEINEAGGIGGKKVELLVEDSGSDPKQGQTAADRLISAGVVGIVGEVASGITAQIAQSAYKAGVPVVAVGATRTDLTDIGNNIFRVCYTDDLQGPVMARFAYEDLGLRNMAVLTDNQQPYSQGLSASFKKKFEELGGKVVGEEFYKSNDTQFQAQITNIKGMNPDGIFMSGYFTEVGVIAREVKDQGLNVKMLGGDGWDSTDLHKTSDAIHGGYFCNHYNNKEDRPEVKSFLEGWQKMYKAEPGTAMGALGYDATKLMMDAIGRAEAKDTAGIIAALDNTENFQGVSGAITLKGHNGNPPKRALVVELTPEGQVFAKAFQPE